MNTRTLIEELDKLNPENEREVTKFLESCRAYTRLMNIWTNQMQDKYGIDLTKTNTGEGEALSQSQKIASAIAADLYYQHTFLDRNINIDKLNLLAKTFPEHPELNLVIDATHYYGMSLQSYLHDAEGGIMTINAHTIFAQNRMGSVPGQLINQIIIPGIREITAEYTGSHTGEEAKYKRGLFFSKAHSSLAKRVEEETLRIMFVENYQPYIAENPVEHTITNEVYHDKNAEIMRAYDNLLLRQTQKVNEGYREFVEEYKNKTGREKVDFITQDRAYAKLEREIREQETSEEKQLKRQVEDLPTSDDNEERARLINDREYSDNTKKCLHDLSRCVQYLDAELKRENSVELIGKLKKTILNPMEEHGFSLEQRKTKTLQKV